MLLGALVSLFVNVVVYSRFRLFVGSADEEYTDDDEECRKGDFVNPSMGKLLLQLPLLRLEICFTGKACSSVDGG